MFGCVLCDDEWRVSHDQKYYGSGTVRVFSFKSDATSPEVFKCTLANSYFLFTSPDCIGVGGDGGGFAIYLVITLSRDINLTTSIRIFSASQSTTAHNITAQPSTNTTLEP